MFVQLQLVTAWQRKGWALLGEKCLVKYIANKNPILMLLDTGTQVSIVSKSYLIKNYPELIVKLLKYIF